MNWRVFTLLIAAMLAGCGGGGGGSSSAPSVSVAPAAPAATPTPAPVSASTSAAISPAGGHVSTTLNGETVVLTVPAGALSAASTVTLDVYAQAALPRALQSRVRRTQALPSASSFIVGMSVSIGAATLLRPLFFTVTGAPASATGNVIRLAGSRADGFGDVDTATAVNGTISESRDPAYAGVTLVGAAVLYAFYQTPAASAAAAPAVTLTVAGPATVDAGAQAAYTASEVDADGFPFLTATQTFSVSSTALGQIAPTGLLTAATANNAAGSVIATDARNPAISGSLAVTIENARPATAGDTLAYAGTLSTSIANDAIAASPVTTTQTGSVTQTVVVGSNNAGLVGLTTNESDAFELSSLTTKTTSTVGYQTAGTSTAVRLLQTLSTDSNNAIYQTNYTPTSGLLTVEPETTGGFGPNDASQTYTETDPGINVGASGQNPTTTRVTNADGSYTERTTNADGSTNLASANADGSGSYVLQSSVFGTLSLTIGAPNAAGSGIPLTLASQSGSQTAPQTVQAPLWYPLPTRLYTESDSIVSAPPYDTRCNVPAKYGPASAVVTEQIVSIDPVYGNLERQTSTAYDVIGVGTVCSIFTDVTQTFYDYTGQEPYAIDVAATAAAPIIVSTTTEVLSITGGQVSGQPVSTQARQGSAATLSHVAVMIGRARFLHAVHQRKAAQAARLTAALRRFTGVR